MSPVRRGHGWLVAVWLALGGCAAQPDPPPDGLPPNAEAALERFRASSPRAGEFLSEACGYAVFPTVARFVLGFGGGSATGVLVDGSGVIGAVRLAEFIHGISFGGEVYSQLIIFKDARTLESFKRGNLEFRGRAATSVGPLGGSADPAFSDGVAVFTLTRAGLMLDLSVAAAKFRFSPRAGAPGTVTCNALPEESSP